MRELVRAGIVIQGSSALTLVAQNILAPRLMGAESYGVAVAMLALPLLLQGVIEPMVNGASIAARSQADHDAVLRKAWSQLGVLAPLAAVLAVLVASQWYANVWQSTMLCGFVVLAWINTALRGLAFAGQRHKTLAGHYVIALVSTVACIPLLIQTGASGYLAMMCVVQVAVLAILLADPGLRSEAKSVLLSRVNLSGFAFAQTYLANLAPRATALMLGPGLLFVASHQVKASDLAEFKVCQTLVGALASLLPLNPALLQAYAAASRRAGTTGRRDEGPISKSMIVLGVVLIGAAVSVLWLLYPAIMGFLLDQSDPAPEFRLLVWAGPFFVAAPLLSSLLLGLGLETAALAASVLCVAAILLTAVVFGAAVAFVAGSALAAAAPAAVGWWLARG